MEPTPPRVACIINPARRYADRTWQLVQQHCSALGFPAPIRFDTTIDHPGGHQVAQALESGATSIVAHGGDGTIRNVGKELAHTDVPLGIVPAGTANIFHLNAVGKQRNIDQSVRTALLGPAVPIDIGRVRLQFADDRADIDERFLAVVGTGRDAEALQRISPQLKRRFGPAAYFLAGAGQLLQPQQHLQIEIGGELLAESPVWSVLVGNCGRVPGGITVLPGANLQDGLLNVMSIAPRSLASWAPIAWRAWRGSTRDLGTLMESTATEITIIPEHPIGVQIDGDVWPDVSRIEIEAVPSALRVRTTSGFSNDNPGDSIGDQEVDPGMDRPLR